MEVFRNHNRCRFGIGFVTFIPSALLIHFLYYGSFLPQQPGGPLPDMRLAAGVSAALFVMLVLLIRCFPLNTHLLDIVYIICIVHTAFLALTAVEGRSAGAQFITHLLFLALALYFERITDWLKKQLSPSARSNQPPDH